MFNVLRCLVSRATIGIADRLRGSDNGARIFDNAAGISDNSAKIGNDAAGIIDIAANVIRC